jgi:integrase/recombinase XerC
LFTNFDRAGKGDGRLTPKCIGDLTQRAGETAGLKGITPHKIRHAAITHILDITQGDVRAVARFSGHRDIRVLTVYDDNREDLGGKISKAIDNIV